MNLLSIFEAKRQSFQANLYPSLKTRHANLVALKKLLQEHAAVLADAVNQDFSYRAQEETLFLEIFPAINAIDYCRKHLKKWTKPQKRQVPWYLTLSKASVIAQPCGVVGIIVPWNYPIYLSIVPLVYALAAGNHVMLKFSEKTPQTGEVLEKLLITNTDLTNRLVVNVTNGGDIDLAKEFASLPFNHLLFTGSTVIGKQIMALASKNLTPITLELGGKSPAIISNSANFKHFDRLFMGKLFNAGQTCIAPDYLLIPKNIKHLVEGLLAEFMERHYPNLMDNKHYSSLISEQHKERLQNILMDAEQKGAKIIQIGDIKKNYHKLPVYLLFDVNHTMQIMQEEVFGPLLPIVTYESFHQILDIMQAMPCPLVVYYFGNDKKEINLLQYHTLSGALTINDTIMHAAIDDLPFGGIGHSGFGRYHGHEGFLAFSNIKPIYRQGRISPISWLYPPYGKLMRYFLRYFGGMAV